jgi:hypothetical protein
MATVSSRQGLIDYCLRRLGFPVIEINVDEDQIEDRIDDALQYFQEFHFDGVERTYLKHQITGNTLKFSGLSSPSFDIKEKIVGETSGASCYLVALNGTTATVGMTKGVFQAGENVTGVSSGFTRALATTNFYTAGDLDNQYIPIPDSVIGIIKMFNFNAPGDGMENPNNMFNLVYQFRLNDMYNLLSADLIYYAQVKTTLQMYDQIFPGQRSIRFNRKTDRLYIDVNWDDTFQIGDYIIVECYRILDPNTYTQVYNDRFLKTYATALLKKQWGDNMKKFGGIQLPGGVILNGKEVYDEAVEEIRMIQQDMQLSSELPVDFMVG